MKILVLDNYDSFVYNLVHILRELGHEPEIYRNDKIEIADVAAFDKILLSPGPGLPDEAGILKAVIRGYGKEKSILGICLGHQAIAEVYGASLFNIPQVLHGVSSETSIVDKAELLFSGIEGNFKVCHYHSWAVDENTLNNDLIVTAKNADGLIMGLRHATYDVRGLQFHPESIMTQHGKKKISSWLNQ
ncbi:MAG TPA: aminodeoxychorismate/anthranilate synthase component II [Cyclobacteriaceae bacterium]|nr:aminodeoxychorismate/anthranilate synthase component II [Cyclobacteriaceae bacterium]